MALSLNKARVSPIAIDFGADTIKLLQLMPGRPAQLAAAAAAMLPPGTRKNPTERISAIGSTLRTLLKQAPFKGRRVICSIPAFQMLIQNLDLPGGEDTKVEEQVHQQLRERLSVEPRAMVVRYFETNAKTRARGGRREFACFAALKQTVMQYIEACHQCKLEVVGMHAEPLALLEASRSGDAGQTTQAVIDIGAATTKLLITRGGELAFAKSIHAGGDQVTQQVAQAEGVEFDEARRLRGQPELAATAGTPAPAAASSGVNSSRLVAHLDTFEKQTEPEPSPASRPATAEMITCLVDELQLCMRFYHQRNPDDRVERLIFVGGEANDTAACQSVARSLGIAAQLGDPLGGIVHLGNTRCAGVDLDRTQPAWAVARGLISCEGKASAA